MPSPDARAAVAVGLVHPPGDQHGHLRDALRDLGANIVYEAETVRFDRSALEQSGAQVVIVNLDPDNDEQIDAIDDLIVDEEIKVVFNDGEVSSRLTGFDLARWARHLAAKIIGDVELLPPRPAGAEAVPVRNMPQHAMTSTIRPASMDAPSVSDDDMLQVTDAIAGALASFDTQTVKLEEKNAESKSEEVTDFNALLGDFGLADPPAASLAPSVDNPFADLGLELALPEAGTDVPADEAANPPVPENSIEVSAEPAGEDSSNPFDGLGFNLDFDKTTEPVASPVGGLEELFEKIEPPKESEAPERSTPNPEPAAAAQVSEVRATSRAGVSAPLDLGLEPEGTTPLPPVAPMEKTKEHPVFSFNIDHLALEPTDEERGPDDPFADRGMASESVLHHARGSKKAEPAAAPKAEVKPAASVGAPGAVPDLSDTQFALDETVELRFDATSAVTSTTAEEDDFMREFAALTEDFDPAASTVTAHSELSRVCVLGASIGGPDAVREFLSVIPPDIEASFVLAQHMGADFVDLMVGQIQKATRLPVAMAATGMQIGNGQVLVVPIAERMLLDPSGEVTLVSIDQPSPYSPSIDRVLMDVADRFGSAAMAIIFSGMAHDAIEGAKHIAAKGGQVWAQDPSTCVVSSMIDGAMDAGVVGFIGAPSALAAEFVRRCGKA